MADVSSAGNTIGSGDAARRAEIVIRRKKLEISQADMALEENAIRRMELDATIEGQEIRVATLKEELAELESTIEESS